MISPYVLPGLNQNVLPTKEGILEKILEECCRASQASIDNVKSDSQEQNLCFTRHLYCWKARTTTGHSLGEISAIINRDHSTVIHSLKKVKEFIETKDDVFTRLMNRL